MALGSGGAGKVVFWVAALLLVVVALRALGAGTNEAAAAWAALGQGALLVDVRTEAEFRSGHLDGALNVPHDRVTARLSEFGPDKKRPIVVYCRSGRRSSLAAAELERNGYTHVINGGGIGQMQAAKPATPDDQRP